ncbi:helix-turn-helix domain-containing protein [Streptomyces sp. NPDC001890]|uniref:helix-turn-helix domain-containing protein n=1 Tax=Streptomyces sp. NPDC001890 TaxID=3364620 RepID=UPI0036B535AA
MALTAARAEAGPSHLRDGAGFRLPEAADSPGTSRFLTEAERIHIADRLRERASIRCIASELGRSPSTISREVRRNRRPMPNGGFAYQPFHAHRR